MARSVVIQVPLFSGYVQVCTSKKSFAKAATKLGIKPYSLAGSGGLCDPSTLPVTGVVLVGVFDGELSTLVHELFHAVVHLMAWTGVPLKTGAANETYAYLLGYLYDAVVKTPGLKID